MKLRFITIFLLSSTILFAQLPPSAEAQAQAQLLKVGGDEDEIRKRLLERGIDVDNMDLSNPMEVNKLQTALEEIEKELAAEKKESIEKYSNKESKEELDEVVKDVASSTAEEITKAVKDGATVEEAIAEEIIDAQKEEDLASVIYGQHIFRNKEISTYRNANDIIAPDSYILGEGDKIAIALWGRSELDVSFEINKDGYIKPQGMPRINLKGFKLGKAKELLRKRFSNYYRFGKDQFEVTVTYPRTITVNIVGEVMNQGSFTFPAVNTAFNALAAADGPSKIGSVRNIKVIQRGGTVKELDVYKFLLDPGVAEEYYLQDGDYIHVGVAERMISIQGSIRRPYWYELKADENLKDLVKYAGGLPPYAYQNNFQIRRFIDDKVKIIDVNYRELVKTNRDFLLLGGDEVVIGDIPKPYQNFVEVGGAVDIPGKYELERGMKIKDLIEKGILSDSARMDIAYLLRTNSNGTVSYSRLNLTNAIKNGTDNIELSPKDKLIIYDKKRYVDEYKIFISGAIREPDSFSYAISEQLKIEDLIILSGGLREDAADFAYVYRATPSNTKTKEYIRVDLIKALENPSSKDNIILKPNDKVEILSTLPYIDEFYVKVLGEVRNPGEYQYHPSLNLKDVLSLSGGVKYTAARNRIDVFRIAINDNEPTKSIVATLGINDNMELLTDQDFQLEAFDQIVVRSVPEFELQQMVFINGEVTYPGPYALLDNNEKVANLIKRAGGLTGEAFSEGAELYRKEGGMGYVILRLDNALKSKTDRHNIILKQGDVITIPKRKDLVSVVGATRAIELYPDDIAKTGRINVAFNSGKRAMWYVNEYAAGIGKNGKKKLIVVEYPNGEVKRTKNFFFFKVTPKVQKGSVVKVGLKIQKEKEERDRERIDWGKVLGDSVAQATAVLSLILLVQRVN